MRAPGSGFPLSAPPSAEDSARREAFAAREQRRKERAAVAGEIWTAQAVVRARERVQRARRVLGESGVDLGRGLRKLREARQDLEQAEADVARAIRCVRPLPRPDDGLAAGRPPRGEGRLSDA